jgi:hypothetical protein
MQLPQNFILDIQINYSKLDGVILIAKDPEFLLKIAKLREGSWLSCIINLSYLCEKISKY